MLTNYDLEATGINTKKRARIQQTDTFANLKKQTPQGVQEQEPRGNRTQVKKACVTTTAQLVPWAKMATVRVWFLGLDPQKSCKRGVEEGGKSQIYKSLGMSIPCVRSFRVFRFPFRVLVHSDFLTCIIKCHTRSGRQ